MHQKGGIHFDEATVVNMTAVVPGGKAGVRANAVGSHLDIVPTVLSFADLSADDVAAAYPDLHGRDLSQVFRDPEAADLPRGPTDEPGDGALVMWDGLHQQYPDWVAQGAVGQIIDLPLDEEVRRERLLETGGEFGAPDLSKRTFYRALIDGRYKLVRWFSPLEYGMPTSVDELYENVGRYSA